MLKLSSVALKPPHPLLQPTATGFSYPFNLTYHNTMNRRQKVDDHGWLAEFQTGTSAWPHRNGDECSSASRSTRVDRNWREHSARQTISSDRRLSLLALLPPSSSCHLSRSSTNKNELWESQNVREGRLPEVENGKLINYICNHFKKINKELREHALILQLAASNKQSPQTPKYSNSACIHRITKQMGVLKRINFTFPNSLQKKKIKQKSELKMIMLQIMRFHSLMQCFCQPQRFSLIL